MTDSQTVFVVDDDEAVRDSLKVLLESSGLAVATFGSGQDFLDCLDQARSGCVILDVRMPGLSGLELQGMLAESQDTIPVIIITGHGDLPMAVQAMKAGAVDFIEKPVDADVLLESVRVALARSKKTIDDTSFLGDLHGRLARLTPRERDVLEQLVVGNLNKIIAHELGISPRTVEVHRARVFEKMEAKNLSHLVRLAIAAGIAPEESRS
ncbi:transcriptional regulatory protein FixJ [bacterium MnTg02]|nr:transcriptional regulatory protein FixJ [bacterium MnTg02]